MPVAGQKANDEQKIPQNQYLFRINNTKETNMIDTFDAPDDGSFNLADFAWFPGGFVAQAQELAALAQSERWGDPSGDLADDLSVLLYYLSNTARRVDEQDKFEYRTDDRGIEVAALNIGLFTSNYEPIFGFLERNDPDRKQPWRFRSWVTGSDFRMRSFGDAMPNPATYFENPTDLLYDRRLKLNPGLDHIVDDNVGRYPEVLRDNRQLRRNALHGAIDEALKRVQQSYKTAVPHWYWPTVDSAGHMQLLLPLCLIEPGRADLALVIDRTEHGYAAHTVLPLDGAYKRARLVARPDVDWLEREPDLPDEDEAEWRRCSRGDRCPICGAEVGCFLSGDNLEAMCRAAEFGGERHDTERGVSLFKHSLRGV